MFTAVGTGTAVWTYTVHPVVNPCSSPHPTALNSSSAPMRLGLYEVVCLCCNWWVVETVPGLASWTSELSQWWGVNHITTLLWGERSQGRRKADPVGAHNNERRGLVDRYRQFTQGLSYLRLLISCVLREARGWWMRLLMTGGGEGLKDSVG